jgi:hypothetical protein
MALDITKNDNDPTMNEVLKKERIAKIESRINRDDKHTMKAILEWVRGEKDEKKVVSQKKKEPLNFDEIDTSMLKK